MNPVVIDELLEQLRAPEKKPIPKPTPTPIPLSFPEVGCAYPSGRSFAASVVLHQLVLLLIVFFSRHAFVRSVEIAPPTLATVIPLDREIYLPVMGGGSEGAGKRGGGSGSGEKLSSGVRARGRRGFAYPGPQPLVSDPPRATLGIQTILQPELINPPLLRRLAPLPNLFQPAPVAAAEPPKSVQKVLGGELALHPPSTALIPAPKLQLPIAAVSRVPLLDASEPIVPRLVPAKPQVERPVELSEVPADRKRQQGVLVVNAIPGPPDVPKNVPRAEARSLFAVTPGETTIIADPGAGSKGGGLPSMAAGVGSPADVVSGDALAEAAAGGGSKNLSGSGSGNGGRYGSGKGSGLNPTGEGAATGRGVASATGSGSGAGRAVGSGTGAGSAAGGGGFPGMTITGGNHENGSGNADVGGLHFSLTAHRLTPYEMTITSTANSGGGMADFGVFSNEKVYTVYLDMRDNDQDPTPSWTLQYAVLQPTGSQPIHGTLTPPYATLKEIPEFSAAQAAKCAHEMVVASAILNAAGRLEQISLKQTPDASVSALLIEALKSWMFEPAQVDGKPVALKLLLGVRLARH